MSYYRLYPTKNNSIFQYVAAQQTVDEYGIPTLITVGSNINCGANEIMELQDGKGESQLMFGFTLPDWLITKINTYTFTAGLQLWDAGTLFQPALPLKEITLASFDVDFAEGDGYSFQPPNALAGASNWLKRDDTNFWSDVTFTDIDTMTPDSFNQDLNFDITSSITDFANGSTLPRYQLRVTTPALDINVNTKYIHSQYTKTLFKPYIEFFIEDTILDASHNCVANISNKIYLTNQTGKDFVGTLTATVTHEGAGPVDATVVHQAVGVYYIEITPPMPLSNKSVSIIIWTIDSIDVKKQLINIKSPNQLEAGPDLTNLFFYPATPYSHGIVRQGDIIPFKIISEIRGKSVIVNPLYEYRITTADGFEMIPWTGISVYRDKMYFNVSTDFFYPEQQYEVWVRNNAGDFIITSNLTHKFKVAMNDKSHLRELATSPYYSRDVYFGK